VSSIVLVHGAFRGGWAWDAVASRLRARGHDVVAPTLTGCDGTPPAGPIPLEAWISDIVDALGDADAQAPAVLVGHSLGGLVTTAVAGRLGARIGVVVHIDAPVPRDGERGVDLNPPGVPAPPPGLDPSLMLPPRPVGPDDGFLDADAAAEVNARLTPTPLGPSLDPVTLTGASPLTRHVYAFCSGTPQTYPAWSTRLRLDASRTPYALLDSAHDAPLLIPDAVTGLVIDAIT
jgi:pimeloyl-ACP methyl ester carboxylesterase